MNWSAILTKSTFFGPFLGFCRSKHEWTPHFPLYLIRTEYTFDEKLREVLEQSSKQAGSLNRLSEDIIGPMVACCRTVATASQLHRDKLLVEPRQPVVRADSAEVTMRVRLSLQTIN